MVLVGFTALEVCCMTLKPEHGLFVRLELILIDIIASFPALSEGKTKENLRKSLWPLIQAERVK